MYLTANPTQTLKPISATCRHIKTPATRLKPKPVQHCAMPLPGGSGEWLGLAHPRPHGGEVIAELAATEEG